MRMLFFMFICWSFYSFGQWNPIPPLAIPMQVTAGFGEVRANHFHSGLDLSTGGKQVAVYAVEDGVIYRIRTSARGYGRTLYINHPGGLTSVYGHLDRFAPEFERYIREIQYKTRRFEQDTLYQQGFFKVKKGQIIAYSGNSGSSTGPHLHFEIRDQQTEEVLNPLEHRFSITDNMPPEIRSVVLIPKKGFGTVNASGELIQLPLLYDKSKKKKVIGGKVKRPVVSGWVGFGFKGGDVIGKKKHLSGIYEITIEVDGKLIYKSQLDRFSFAETRCVNGFIDYPTRIKSKTVLYKCIVPVNNMIGIYKQSTDRGYFNFNENRNYTVKYRMKDFAGNITVQEIEVKGSSQNISNPVKLREDAFHKIVYPGSDQSLTTESFEAEFSAECLFDTSLLLLKSRDVKNAYSQEFTLGNIYIPINQPVLIRLLPVGYNKNIKNKLVILRRSGQREVSLGGYWMGDWLSAKTTEFGDFRVVADTVPPHIRFLPSYPKRGSVKSQSEKRHHTAKKESPEYAKASGIIRFKISEKLSGLRDIHAWLNEEWILLEPSDENSSIYQYRFEEELPTGVYCLKIQVTDGSDNIGIIEMEFDKR